MHPHKGYLDAVERNIDPTTGTLAMQFKFPNPERLVRPGQYGRARFVIDAEEGRAARAAARGAGAAEPVQRRGGRRRQQGRFRNVKVGPREGSLWVIEEGLKPGEQVVVEGLQRLRDGTTVTPKPAPADGRRRRAPRRRGEVK